MMIVFTLLTLFLHLSHSWVLHSTHSQINVGVSTNVTLECKYGIKDNGNHDIDTVLRLSIYKLQENKYPLTYAMVRIGHPLVDNHLTATPSARVNGLANKATDSFLSITWSTASPDTVGQYACEVNGFAANDSPVHINTANVTISDVPITLNKLLHMILDMKTRSDQIQKKMDENAASNEKWSKYVETVLTKISLEVDDLRRTTSNKQPNASEKVQSIVETEVEKNLYERRNWPGGRYALLNTLDGCPASLTTIWKVGYTKIRSESDNNHLDSDAVSNPNHLAPPIFERTNSSNFFYLPTCMRNSNSFGPAWPRGSYCIHRVQGICPPGFSVGGIKMNQEDNNYPLMEVSSGINQPDIYTLGSTISIFYCCRNDGDYQMPITLPVEKPFILYRYKGNCQKVRNAMVTNEWIRIDTEDTSNADSYLTSIYPDSRLNPVYMDLCYYHRTP